jgi:hypothetical protein
MDPGQRQYLERRYAVGEWHGRDAAGRRSITGFGFAGSELSGWTLHRSRRDEHGAPPAIRTLWHRGDPGVEMLAIDVWECASIPAAHDQLLEVLANFQSGEVERRTGSERIGDVLFTLDKTMALFARVNVVVLIRNAGPQAVDVDPVSRAIDELLVRTSDSSPPSRRRPTPSRR